MPSVLITSSNRLLRFDCDPSTAIAAMDLMGFSRGDWTICVEDIPSQDGQVETYVKTWYVSGVGLGSITITSNIGEGHEDAVKGQGFGSSFGQ